MFHGTAHEFAPGDLVDPSNELGGRRGDSYVFMTSDLEVAMNYGRHKAWARSLVEPAPVMGRAYEVEPTGAVEADDTVDDRLRAWRSKQPLKIVREVWVDH